MTLTFGLATTPAAATLVVTPRRPGATPVSITLIVHRQVTSWQYVWIPLIGGLGLALLLVTGTWLSQRTGLVGFWGRPLYASAAWTFGDSWATNITAVGTVIATVLTASGAVSELLPGVELSRFSLLLAAAGGITVAAPLVFGVLNYRFTRVDPTTAGVTLITLPRPITPQELRATLSGSVPGRSLWSRTTPAGSAVTIPISNKVRTEDGKEVTLRDVAAQLKPGTQVTLLKDTPVRLPHRMITLLRSRTVGLPGSATKKLHSDIQAALLQGGTAKTEAIIKVPAGATINVPTAAEIGTPGATSGAPAPATPTHATPDPGTALTVPAAIGASITVPAPQPDQRTGTPGPILALTGTNDIAVSAGQTLKISAAVTGKDKVTVKPEEVTVPGGAKVSFLGRASIELPAGTRIDAAAVQPGPPVKSSLLGSPTVFTVPHTGQVVAAQMWSLLAAACLTMFGIGAELTIIGVLGFTLSAAGLTVRLIIAGSAAVGAAVVSSTGC